MPDEQLDNTNSGNTLGNALLSSIQITPSSTHYVDVKDVKSAELANFFSMLLLTVGGVLLGYGFNDVIIGVFGILLMGIGILIYVLFSYLKMKEIKAKAVPFFDSNGSVGSLTMNDGDLT